MIFLTYSHRSWLQRDIKLADEFCRVGRRRETLPACGHMDGCAYELLRSHQHAQRVP